MGCRGYGTGESVFAQQPRAMATVTPLTIALPVASPAGESSPHSNGSPTYVRRVVAHDVQGERRGATTLRRRWTTPRLAIMSHDYIPDPFRRWKFFSNTGAFGSFFSFALRLARS
jgi:hypothetical protein